MSETKMPAAEVGDSVSYELAFHVLPTVAEGEVPAVFEKLKTALTKVGVEIIDEEAPARIDLAYEIVEYLEGRNRKFSSAYFGWVRFTAQPEDINQIGEMIDGTKELLRHLLIKLTKIEEANPFRYHDAMQVKNVDVVDEDSEEDTKNDDSEAVESEEETTESASEDDNGEESK